MNKRERLLDRVLRAIPAPKTPEDAYNELVALEAVKVIVLGQHPSATDGWSDADVVELVESYAKKRGVL